MKLILKSSPSLPSVFPALSLALVFARAPQSERLEQAKSTTDCMYRGNEILGAL